MCRVSILLCALLAAAGVVSGAGSSHLESGTQLLGRGNAQHNSHHRRFQVVARQNSAGSQSSQSGNSDEDGPAQTNAQTSSGRQTLSSSASQSSSTSRGGGLISDISNILDPETSTTTSSTSSLPQSTSTESSSEVVSTTSSELSTSSDVEVENVTVISTIPFSQPTTASSSSAADASLESQNSKKDDSSSGLSKTTIIIIVVVASCVGGAIAIWTIVRKIKLSPSSRFDRKLAPIDFGPGRRDSDIYDGSQVNFAASPSAKNIVGAEPWPMHRSPSVASSHNSDGVKRQPSNAASQMLGRAGSPEYRSDHGHGPAMSEAGYSTVYPSLPPQTHSYQNLYAPPAAGYDGSGYSNYNGVGYSASTRRPNY